MKVCDYMARQSQAQPLLMDCEAKKVLKVTVSRITANQSVDAHTKLKKFWNLFLHVIAVTYLRYTNFQAWKKYGGDKDKMVSLPPTNKMGEFEVSCKPL